MVLRVLWISLIVLLGLGVLSSLTLLLGWQQYVALSLAGLLAGLAVLVALVGSARSRELTSLILGAVTLPVLAAHLGGVAARSAPAFTAYSASLLPFLAHATVVILGGAWMRQVWQRRPGRPTPDGRGEDVRPRTAGAAP
jgi:hypothetical protein